MFLILRKNTKLLNEYVKSGQTKQLRNNRRANIIYMKSLLSALPARKYNLLKTIATDVNRFEILKPVREFTPQSDIVNVIIPGTNIVLSTYDKLSYVHKNSNTPDPQILYDTILNHYFILEETRTLIQDVTLFSNLDHTWFTDVFNAIKDAKNAESEIIKQRQIMAELRKIESYKEGILDKYS
jgi:hypothetical protein